MADQDSKTSTPSSSEDSLSNMRTLISASSEYVLRHRRGGVGTFDAVGFDGSLIQLKQETSETSDSSLNITSSNKVHRPSVARAQRTSLNDDYELHLQSKNNQATRHQLRLSNNSKSGTSLMSKSATAISKQQAAEVSTLEVWWITSPWWRRSLIFVLLILVVITLLHLAISIFCVVTIFTHEIPDPEVCSTVKCMELGEWMNKSSKLTSINPCSDFYDFTCGNHKQGDTGDIWEWWWKNFARLEADGENGDSILSKIFTRPDHELAQRIVKYYQVCMKMWLVDTLQFEVSFTKQIRHVFKNFDVYGNESFGLERAASNLIQLYGDDGFYETYAPVSYPKVVRTAWSFIKDIEEKNVGQFLPIIYNALNIKNDTMHRETLSNHFFVMMRRLSDLISKGKTTICGDDANKTVDNGDGQDSSITGKVLGFDYNYDFELPWYFAYYGEENVDMNKTYKLKEGKQLQLKIDPLKGPAMAANFKQLTTHWNCVVKDKFKEEGQTIFIKPMYATFWSLRLLIELVHDADATTASDPKWGMENKENKFFKSFQENYLGRLRESRCYQSMLDSMGFYPVFRYFETQTHIQDNQAEAMGVIRHAAKALLEQFRPPEEGGVPYISSMYREKIYRILSDPEATNIIIPIVEDDRSFHWMTGLSPDDAGLKMSENHIDNAIRWRSFTWKRTRHFWVSKSPRQKLVWHKDFYQVDHADVYEAPATAPVTLLRFPPSIFMFPFWNNDIEIANYAGARLLAAKEWMMAISSDVLDHNILEDIKVKKASNQLYREGITSDGDFKSCEAITYGWFHPEPIDHKKGRHKLTEFSPHFLATRHGFIKHDDDYDHLDNDRVEIGNAIWQTMLPVKTILNKFFQEVNSTLRSISAFDMSPKTRKSVLYTKLKGFENYNEQQLFFLIYFRELCRSKETSGKKKDYYFIHVIENMEGVMQMKEFSKTWKCPVDSPMNPPKSCFK